MFDLPELPYPEDALEPVFSARTMRIHHGKHHATYVSTLNKLLATEDDRLESLEDVIRRSAKSPNRKLFNNAAQVWNHSFFWVAMTPARTRPNDTLAEAIEKRFGSMLEMTKEFVTAGAGHFGSGWLWLIANHDGTLNFRTTHDADDTLTYPKLTPLIVCDLWEHAYYLDHQNDRKGFLEVWFANLLNWTFASAQYAAALGEGELWHHPLPAKSAVLTKPAAR